MLGVCPGPSVGPLDAPLSEPDQQGLLRGPEQSGLIPCHYSGLLMGNWGLQLARILNEQGSIICQKSGHNSAS